MFYTNKNYSCICELVRKHPSAFMLCAGDLNLPDINWTND